MALKEFSAPFSKTKKTFSYYKNEYRNKLEYNLCDNKMEVVVHYQFYKGILAIRAWTIVTWGTWDDGCYADGLCFAFRCHILLISDQENYKKAYIAANPIIAIPEQAAIWS